MGPAQLDPVRENRTASNITDPPRPGPCGPGHVESDLRPLTLLATVIPALTGRALLTRAVGPDFKPPGNTAF